MRLTSCSFADVKEALRENHPLPFREGGWGLGSSLVRSGKGLGG
jgi:hypothetical protein